jgi:hypothetical protein
MNIETLITNIIHKILASPSELKELYGLMANRERI